MTGKYLKQVRPDVDERLQPAVRFEFDARGASRFGRLTHEHRPEEGGSFQYQLAILLDNLVMSAPASRPRSATRASSKADRRDSRPRKSSTWSRCCAPAACRQA